MSFEEMTLALTELPLALSLKVPLIARSWQGANTVFRRLCRPIEELVQIANPVKIERAVSQLRELGKAACCLKSLDNSFHRHKSKSNRNPFVSLFFYVGIKGLST